MHCDVNLYVNEHVHGMKYYIYITAHIQVWQGLPLLARYMGGTERGAVECQNFYFATGKHTINNCSLTIIKVYQVHRTPTFENISVYWLGLYYLLFAGACIDPVVDPSPRSIFQWAWIWTGNWHRLWEETQWWL